MRLSFGITSKLFVALFALSMVVALAMGAAVRWRFDTNFLDYVNAREAERMAVFAQSIESVYAEHGNWGVLRNDRQAWYRLIRREIGRTHAGPFGGPRGDAEPVPPFAPPPGDVPPPGLPPPPPDAGDRPPQHPPGEGPGMHPPIWLLDAGRVPIVGDGPPPGPGSQWHALHHNGQTVGWLATPQRMHVPEGADQAFLAQQLRATWIIAALSVLLAAGVAILLARGVLAPMRRLAHATRRMAEGDYAARVDVHSGDEIGHLADDFNRLAETLEANQKMRRQLTADISHELRTPLAVLRGELEALEDGVRALTPASLTSLQAEVGTLSKLIDDLYELSLADVGALAFHMESIDLADTVCSAAQGFTPRLMDKRIALQLDLPTGPSRDAAIQGDPQRLRQLMQNLLENTLRYTDAGGTLRIHVHRAGAWWCLDVQDSAPGVPEAMLPRVFDRLFRADPSRGRAQGGAGLGLSLCQTIVQTHGGTIDARPSPLGGLWIAIRLPAANSSVADHDPDR
ncbi:ATP-binding protein [Ralstonia pseudosolanacearum]|uniref:histidine kinase n=1 Tax=Ralstonia nicotianae (strain ATCC BAA-1114 / GMI1000) TaxID=267608 RepID=Q8XQQ9_RALN1|nr:ATP-binding protein [Ralstonia pseudosolanacearum]AST30132.1 two-component sensor histidine kinase [Ralstonia pseudosolanacearum]MDC6286121.1 ATP-binding protein [Ralstonia pseudosolanacearum]CAD18313.1 probable two-component sensor histidine kinase transcription regulator protein [Ralstonia pseudosolanacearum GMI1000]